MIRQNLRIINGVLLRTYAVNGGRITGSYCVWGFASRKSFTIGTIVDMRAISVTPCSLCLCVSVSLW